ncbi:hypothetical protein V5O48_014946 [Marasmius crinis-equi]|uniref:Zn(2)-C6 fungal-type domain-containing protein n=1 Tax=Marasmius crinis-equi TaxID=585013 RepID=A0ABR3EVY4_9AGAR
MASSTSNKEVDRVKITEEMKRRFAAMYTLKGNDTEKRVREWGKKHASEPCDQCTGLDIKCIAVSGDSPTTKCGRCFTSHKNCSKTVQFRREFIPDCMKITEAQFDTLADWYSSRKAEKVAGSKRKFPVQTNMVQASAISTKRAKRKASESAEISPEPFVGSEPDRSREAAELAAAGFAYYPFSEQTAPRGQTSSRASGERNADSTTIPAPSKSSTELPAALSQLKREIEEITADLRFKRTSKEVAVELYDQTALKLAGIMDRFDVPG